MSNSDTITSTRGYRPGSVADRLAALNVGENLTLSAPHGPAGDSFDAWVKATRQRMQANLSPTLDRVRNRHPERVYETETGVMISGSNRAHVVLVVTRLADVG